MAATQELGIDYREHTDRAPRRRALRGVSRLGAALAFTTLALVSCGSDDKDASRNVPAKPTVPPATAEAEPSYPPINCGSKEFPSIVSPEQTRVGPAAIDVLNCYFEERDGRALVEFVDGAKNYDVQTLVDFLESRISYLMMVLILRCGARPVNRSITETCTRAERYTLTK